MDHLTHSTIVVVAVEEGVLAVVAVLAAVF